MWFALLVGWLCNGGGAGCGTAKHGRHTLERLGTRYVRHLESVYCTAVYIYISYGVSNTAVFLRNVRGKRLLGAVQQGACRAARRLRPDRDGNKKLNKSKQKSGATTKFRVDSNDSLLCRRRMHENNDATHETAQPAAVAVRRSFDTPIDVCMTSSLPLVL